MVNIVVDEQLVLRTYTPADADELFAVINAGRRHLAPWLDWVNHTTRPEHSLKFIEDSKHQLDMQEALALGIFYNGAIVGGVGMYKWEHDVKKARVGYWVATPYEGKGIVTRTLQHFFQFMFVKIGLNKVEIHFSAANKRSAAVAARMGCRVEGIIRQSVQRNGLIEDLVVTGILRAEWQGIQG